LLLFACVSLAFLFIFQTLRRQQRLTEQKDDFVRNMTHELKTPIATVSVAVEALQNFEALQDRARTTEYLQIARLELARLSLLVDKVLRLSLFEQKAPVFQLERLDLKILVKNVLQSMQLQFDQAKALVDISSTGQDFSLRGDTLHLTSVVYNLVDNALKYSPLNPKITITLLQQEGNLSLQIADRGRGIPAAYQQKIFERFFRVPTGDVHDVKGHGLGLSYVAEVVKQHGGHIQVASKPGEGACFTVILPQT
ncbi:MAG: ATP-binding protein, partial [Saprospiraceae bacterium]